MRRIISLSVIPLIVLVASVTAQEEQIQYQNDPFNYSLHMKEYMENTGFLDFQIRTYIDTQIDS